MGNRINQWLEWGVSKLSLVQFLYAVWVGGSGIATAATSSTVQWITQFGWFGWWISFLCGCVLAAAVASLVTVAKKNVAQERAMEKWKKEVDNINPLDKEFKNRRINFNDLKPPHKSGISGRRFIDCELLVYNNILLYKKVSLFGCGFCDCNVIVFHPPKNLRNVMSVEESDFINCEIVGATIFITPNLIDDFVRMGVDFASLTGDPKVDDRQANG